MAGTIICDYIRSDANKISLNVGNTVVASINASGILSNTGVVMITPNGSIVADNISSGNLNASLLTTGSISRARFLTGAVLQSLYQTTNSNVNLTNGVWVNSGLSTNITTTVANSKFVIMASVGYNLQSIPGNGISFRITRGGSGIWTQGQTRYNGISATGDNEGWAPIFYIDSPSSAVGTTLTYEIQAFAHASAGRVQDATDSSIIVMEIAP
jgi:hypothetical protein